MRCHRGCSARAVRRTGRRRNPLEIHARRPSRRSMFRLGDRSCHGRSPGCGWWITRSRLWRNSRAPVGAGKSDAALHLEQLWNDLAQTQSFSLRCAYPIASFSRESDGGPFLKICAAHSEVIPDESYTSLPSSEERLRSIGLLQQRAQALETEKADRQKAQAALRGKESELADVLENALEGAQQTGPNRKILWANRALSKLLGYDATEYIDHSFVDFSSRDISLRSIGNG